MRKGRSFRALINTFLSSDKDLFRKKFYDPMIYGN